MLADKDQKWRFSLELPDIESIFVLTAVTILSGIFVAVSLIVAFSLSSGYFEGLSTLSTDSLDGFLSTIGDTFLYMGGLIFAFSAILFFRAFLNSLVSLYNFAFKGEQVTNLKAVNIPGAVKKLYVSVVVGGGAVLLIFIGIILSQLYNFLSNYLIIGGW